MSEYSKNNLELLATFFLKPTGRGHAHLYWNCADLPRGVYLFGNTKLEDFKYAHPPLAYLLVDLRKHTTLIELVEELLQGLKATDTPGSVAIAAIMNWCKKNKSYDIASVSTKPSAESNDIFLETQKVFEPLDDFFTMSIIHAHGQAYLQVLEGKATTKEVEIPDLPVRVMMLPGPPIDDLCPKSSVTSNYSILLVKGTDLLDDAPLRKRLPDDPAVRKVVMWTVDGTHVDYGTLYRGSDVQVFVTKAYNHLFPNVRERLEEMTTK